jgi:hypothetical protein
VQLHMGPLHGPELDRPRKDIGHQLECEPGERFAWIHFDCAQQGAGPGRLDNRGHML